jgi:beta-glucanase (GH16 family)
MDGWMDEQMYVCVNGWMGGWVDGQMDGRVGG